MSLLELPQEMVDAIALYLDAFAYLTLRQTGKHIYHAFGGDASLRQELVDLETYWSTERQVFATMHNDPHLKTEPYPSYQECLNRAPCYTCLRISTPRNTVTRSWTSEGGSGEGPMLPWDGYGGIHCDRFDAVDISRKCIDCRLDFLIDGRCKENPSCREWAGFHTNNYVLSTMSGEFATWCTTCETKVWSHEHPKARQHRSGLCLPCFEKANLGWLAFQSRLAVRTQRVQRYRSSLERSTRFGGQIDTAKIKTKTQATGPRPLMNDVQEDWALWKDVVNPPLDAATTEVQHARFLDIERQMQRYLMWMRLVDKKSEPACICRHKISPPPHDALVELGDWPEWEGVVAQVKEDIKGWGEAPCGMWCPGGGFRSTSTPRPPPPPSPLSLEAGQ
ncbi:hypothetical protein LTR56_026379 [Elasticomyces elasticus]|nr:hypothetical protein LTR56_026379 [Elasticomyces elasticus]KAK3619974.1 hypothetical protein LTR22_025776 [Elasticomyces elasticus]KAK4904305.1 hypothetical protein LTR49_026224 [Elasticomyces elasticus]KAK5679646.1 hypothetical protein LTR17_027588 [Elasticomyces elasticus]KAK5739102.1 hypothetical protein LTS12_025391 [Elasticomyces elasticus]